MNLEKQNHILHYLKNDTRFDGRKKDEYREIEVETGFIKTAEGSARVKIGNTEFESGPPGIWAKSELLIQISLKKGP